MKYCRYVMKYYCNYVSSLFETYMYLCVLIYFWKCRYGDGLLARPSYRLEPQVLLCSCWAPSPRGATSSSTRGGDLYTPRLVWQVCNEILLFITYIFVGIPLFRQFCLLQVTWGRSTDSEPSCRGWAYSARPIPPDTDGGRRHTRSTSRVGRWLLRCRTWPTSSTSLSSGRL